MRKILTVIMLLTGFAARSQQYYFANYSLDDGLPHSRVNSILQDKDGYIWIASSMGISRFDGHQFNNYTTKDGLGDNKITTLYETKEGLLLAGHENGTLSYWTGKRFNNVKLDEDTRRIFCISPDSKGYLWIGTQASGAFRIKTENLIDHLNKREFERFDNKPEIGLTRDVTSILEDHTGQLWFVTDLGIKKRNNVTGKFEFFLPREIDFVQFSSICEDGNNEIWLGTVTAGAFRYSKKEGRFISYNSENSSLSSNFVSCLHKDKKGRMMVGTWGGGFSVFENGKGENITEANGLAENKVRSLIEDREGNIWIGTNQNGVSCFRGKQFHGFLRSKTGGNIQVGAVMQDRKGQMWFGSNNGVFVMDQNSTYPHKLDFLLGLEDIEITSIIEDKTGNIWIATWGSGIILVKPGSNKAEKFQGKIPFSEPSTFSEQYVHTIKTDSKGRIWISMLRGLALFQPSENTLNTFTKKDGLSDISTTDIEEDNEGNIWIGSAGGGLTKYDGKKFTAVNQAENPVYPAISSLKKDSKGGIWVATEGGGIYFWNGTSFKNYNTNDGIASNFVSLIETDNNGRIWLGTNRGLCSFDPVKKESILFDKSDKSSRIEAKPNAGFPDNKGNLWFGTTNGVLVFDPATIKINTVESITRITAVKVFQDTITEENTRLNHKRNYISFYFNGICFSDPEKVKYQYELEGFDNGWQEPSSLNFVTYNNLPPANYTFRVRSCNNDGIWNETPITFSFTITPPYWMTWWFYTVCAVVILFALFLFIKFRTRNLRREKRTLEKLVNERTAEIVNQKEEIENQRDELRVNSAIIEQKNLSITDSIRYAKRIQLATLPYRDVVFESLKESFILYKPKDIVSGDFYAYSKRKSKILIAVADCTGHGVPGAFMSMIGTNLFNQVINENGITRPSEILNLMNIGIERALKQDETDNHDGMDIIVCALDFENDIFEFSGANRPLLIIRKEPEVVYPGEEEYGAHIRIIRPDKHPIGGFRQEAKTWFNNRHFVFKPGDMIFLYSDGYADQFGGEKGKKLLSKRLRNYLLEIKDEPVNEQEKLLDRYFEKWRGRLEQVDDVLIIGIRYPVLEGLPV